MASLIHQKAPAFTAPAVMPDGTTKEISLSDYAGQYVALVFYPKDFTFVCPTELISMDHRMDKLKELSAKPYKQQAIHLKLMLIL